MSGLGRSTARALDLSAAGIGIEVAGPLPDVGARVESEFALPGFLVPLSLGASVAWADASRSRVGLVFEPLEAGVSELLVNYVAGRL